MNVRISVSSVLFHNTFLHKKFNKISDRVSAGGGCEAAMTARMRCGWAKLSECGELLYFFIYFFVVGCITIVIKIC